MHLLITAAGTVFLASTIRLYFAVRLWVAWLWAVNLVTLLTYGYDKRIAGTKKRSRVAERLLLALAFVGGSPGAWLGMRWFHHKTAKTSFKRKFWLIVILQVLLWFAYWRWVAHLLLPIA